MRYNPPRLEVTVPRSKLPHLLLTASLLLGAIACREGSRPEAQRPRLSGKAAGWNVVIVSIDALRADRLGAYGYKERPTSPRLDAQLAAGVTFEQANAPRAATWPSLASLLTGLYPASHGVTENGYGFPDELPTLPKLLHGKGYQTGAFLSNMCKANHQGWDGFGCTGGEDGKTVRHALDWAGRVKKDRPFALWVHLFGAHGPYYNGGDRAAKELDPGYQGPVGPKRWQLDRIMTERVPLGPRDVHHLDALYDAAVLGSDGLAGDLLDGLARAGLLERTLVVVTADHGEELYDHNAYLYHACSIYQSTLHVPLGFSAPGLLEPGGRIPQTVELVDVLPTLLDLLGIAPPAEIHGRSLVPYLERPGAGGPGKPAFSQFGTTRLATVTAGGFKLVDNPDAVSPVCIPDAPMPHFPIGKVELYDLAKDPGETVNLAAGEPGKVAELQKLLRDRFAALKSRAQGQELSEELKQELKSLGYVAH